MTDYDEGLGAFVDRIRSLQPTARIRVGHLPDPSIVEVEGPRNALQVHLAYLDSEKWGTVAAHEMTRVMERE